MQMRIPKFPHIVHLGMNMHMALPPAPPLVPLPVCGWLVTPMHAPGPFIYGKFSSSHVETEGMWNTLFGHDWGLPGPHTCLIPPTHTPTPSTPLVYLGAGHKFWLPSYSVKEPASGGALAAIGGSATSAVAVTTAIGIIVIQDCQDRNGIGFVLPIGINGALPTTHWVGFGWSDFFAGLAALAFDCIGAIILSKLSNGSRHFSKYSDMTKAIIGIGIGFAGATVAGLMSRYGAPPWLQVVVGVALIGLDTHSGVKLDHTGPAGAGLVGGGLADMIGGEGASGDARGDHDPFFDTPPAVAQGGSPSTPPASGDGGADGGVPPSEPVAPPAPPPAEPEPEPEPNQSDAPPPDDEPNQSVAPDEDAGTGGAGGDAGTGGAGDDAGTGGTGGDGPNHSGGDEGTGGTGGGGGTGGTGGGPNQSGGDE